ncbi:MAG: hypothetical protein IKA32_10155 [Lentisphaeria bacterium]|nr:hypothetical protein [Lentisphaeria bacterium]
MMKMKISSVAALFLLPVLLAAAPASIYGKALQSARNVSAQAQQSRTIAPEQKKKAPAATVQNRMKYAKNFSASVFKAKLKRYPVSGAQGINELLEKKIIPENIFGRQVKRPVSEKNLPVAWFGTEANKAKGKGVFPLFVTKPAFGPVFAGFTDGSVIQLKNSPKSVTGVINILRSNGKNKKNVLWTNYQRTAGKIDRASR